MKKYTAKQLREEFQTFFESKEHVRISSASIVPENDPTVLFTTAGMQPLVPYLSGEKHPQGTRLVDVQKCVRTGDIEEVGDTTHHTFFEMLGNWSLGDYFKKESINWSFEFLTKVLEIPLDRLAVTVFAGDADAPKDDESASYWLDLGVPKERIAYLPKKDNWWGPAGLTGPCGPDTEIFFWKDNSRPAPTVYDSEDKNWVEIWNNVFMQFNKTAEGKYEPLAKQNVDTGMGLERTTAVLNGFEDNYLTDLFWPIIEKIETLTSKRYLESNEVTNAMRIIADHIRASVMIMGDRNGMEPSNVDQGYIVRRLLRRAIRMGKMLGLNDNFTVNLAEPIFEIYSDVYPEIIERKQFILTNLEKEELKFRKTLEDGLKKLDKLIEKYESQVREASGISSELINKDEDFIHSVSGKDAFDLFQTSGLPIEVIEEDLAKRGLFVNKQEFEREFQDQMKAHQDLSRKGAEQKFAGGLADHSIESTRLHTATHLLHKALKLVLDESIQQKGSNITPERLRFDFNYAEKMTPEQLKKVEDIVNDAIKKDMPVSFEEMSFEEAKKAGAIGLFEDKYGEKIKVYTVGDFSKEVCGGPHVMHTGELGGFKILKEESSGAGMRRIKAQVSANLK